MDLIFPTPDSIENPLTLLARLKEQKQWIESQLPQYEYLPVPVGSKVPFRDAVYRVGPHQYVPAPRNFLGQVIRQPGLIFRKVLVSKPAQP